MEEPKRNEYPHLPRNGGEGNGEIEGEFVNLPIDRREIEGESEEEVKGDKF